MEQQLSIKEEMPLGHSQKVENSMELKFLCDETIPLAYANSVIEHMDHYHGKYQQNWQFFFEPNVALDTILVFVL